MKSTARNTLVFKSLKYNGPPPHTHIFFFPHITKDNTELVFYFLQIGLTVMMLIKRLHVNKLKSPYRIKVDD